MIRPERAGRPTCPHHPLPSRAPPPAHPSLPHRRRRPAGAPAEVDDATPGDPPTEACIRVSCTGTPDLGSTVELPTSTVFPDCTGTTTATEGTSTAYDWMPEVVFDRAGNLSDTATYDDPGGAGRGF